MATEEFQAGRNRCIQICAELTREQFEVLCECAPGFADAVLKAPQEIKDAFTLGTGDDCEQIARRYSQPIAGDHA
jgi:UDP:flavonoid glycosyltransferase YjiC (YdhE family)